MAPIAAKRSLRSWESTCFTKTKAVRAACIMLILISKYPINAKAIIVSVKLIKITKFCHENKSGFPNLSDNASKIGSERWVKTCCLSRTAWATFPNFRECWVSPAKNSVQLWLNNLKCGVSTIGLLAYRVSASISWSNSSVKNSCKTAKFTGCDVVEEFASRQCLVRAGYRKCSEFIAHKHLISCIQKLHPGKVEIPSGQFWDIAVWFTIRYCPWSICMIDGVNASIKISKSHKTLIWGLWFKYNYDRQDDFWKLINGKSYRWAWIILDFMSKIMSSEGKA